MSASTGLEKTNEGKQTQSNIVDLDEKVREIAERLHKKNRPLQWCIERYRQWCPSFLQKQKDILELDWSEVKFHPEEPKYTQIGTPVTNDVIVFTTVFENKSQSDQDQTIKIERMTSSTSTFSLTKGFSVCGRLNLNLIAPAKVISQSYGFTKGIAIDNAISNQTHDTFTWSAEGKLVVKKNSKVTAKLQVKEEHWNYDFECRVAVQGTIKGTWYDNNKKKVDYFNTSMRTILIKDMGAEDAPGIDNAAFLTLRGKCGFKFGVEKQIIIE